MKKVLSVLLTVLCLTLVFASTVSATGPLVYNPSFDDGTIIVTTPDDTTTEVAKDPNLTGVPTTEQDKINSPKVSDFTGVAGFPSTSSYNVSFAGTFFDVTGTGPLTFTVQSNDITSSTLAGVLHYKTSGTTGWEFVTGTVDTTNKTASFTLGSGSPVALVLYTAKAPAPAPSGVVNTATY